MTTMREVAALAGVSGKTVSRVINGDRYVSADVRERVQRAIAELSYIPNMLARTFRAGRDTAIGVAVPDIADPFFGAVVQSVERQARARRTAVIVTSLGDDPADERSAVEALLRRQITGLIIAPISTDHSYLVPWQAQTTMVFIDRPPHRITADSVVEDDIGGAEIAVRRLITAGHQRIAFIGNAAAVVTTNRRLAGYRAALAGGNLEPDEGLIRLYRQDAADCVPMIRELLALPDPPTAVFSSNSQSSIAIVPELHAGGNADLAFISFGDFPMAAALRPAVTVLDQDPVGLGQTAAQRLFDRVESPARRLRRHLVLPVQMLIRQSSEAVVLSQQRREL